MDFDSHARRGSLPVPRTIANQVSPGGDVDILAERHAELSRATTGSAVERMMEIDNRARELVQPQRLSWLERLIPTPAQRAQLAAEGQIAETESEFRLRALKVARGVELQLLQDGLNAVRVQHSTILRGITAERVFNELHRIVERFTDAYDDFYARAVDRIARAEALPYEALRQDAYDAILEDLATVRRVKNRLVEQFETIVEEEVRA